MFLRYKTVSYYVRLKCYFTFLPNINTCSIEISFSNYFLFDSAQCARHNFRPRFDADRSRIKLSVIFLILASFDIVITVKRGVVKGLSYLLFGGGAGWGGGSQ
jgi:hypothetical protein